MKESYIRNKLKCLNLSDYQMKEVISFINDKLVKSAITFWFKDEDYDGCKVWNYFKTCE